MIVNVANSRFMRLSLKQYTGAFYQRLLFGVSSFEELGNKLIRQAQTAHAFRWVSAVEEAAMILCSLPLREFQNIGQYYLAWCVRRSSNLDLSQSQAMLENVIKNAATKYKARAILSLGAVSALKGDDDAHLHYYLESIKAARNCDLSTIVEAQQGIAILKAKEGYHKSALRDLEQLLPLAQHSEHLVYHDFLNSYAVELTTAGRIGEACKITNLVVASPFASAYPEWLETLADVRTKHKQRSVVTVSQPEGSPITKARMNVVIEFMKANIQRDISSAEMASIVNLSTSYFLHLFKSEMGIPPIDYLIKLRMEKAGELLATSFLSIKQIMAAVGCNDRSNFLRHFRKRFGTIPTKYRKKMFKRHVPLKG